MMASATVEYLPAQGETEFINSLEDSVLLHKSRKKPSIPVQLSKFRYSELIPGLIYACDEMHELASKIKTVASTDANVLLHGETGTGKELFADAIHRYSNRLGKPFVIVDCCALAREVEDSELFGHVQGSFTGATSGRIGLLEQADNGTVFLDEISELNPVQQGKFLRFIESKTIRRVGTSKYKDLDVRIVAATNKDLKSMVKKGEFREDLYHRLNGVCLKIPPLRNRGWDSVILAAHFLNRVRIFKSFDGLFEMIREHTWRGNVRELKQTLERNAILYGNNEALEKLELEQETIDETSSEEELRLDMVIKKHMQKVLDMNDGSQRLAAHDLGISPRKMNYQKKILGLRARVDLKQKILEQS